MAEKGQESSIVWIPPLTTKSVNILEATMGRFQSPNVNLRLVNGLPYIRVNPMLLWLDIENLVLGPLVCTFASTLIILLTRPDPLTAIQTLQIALLACSIFWFVFLSFLRYSVQNNSEIAAHLNSFFSQFPHHLVKMLLVNPTVIREI